MICLKIENGVVVSSQVWDKCPTGMVEAPKGVGIGFTDNGDGSFSAPEKKIVELTIEGFRSAVGSHIESVARSAGPFGFDSVLSAVSYIGGDSSDINVIYGTAVFEYRSACWASARLQLEDWQASGETPTIESVINALPKWSNYEPS